MIATLLFAFVHFIVALLFFLVVQKPLFILYNKRMNKKKVETGDWHKVFRIGGRTDQIAAAYLTGLPTVLLLVLSTIPKICVFTPLLALEGLLSVLVGLYVVSDTVLYRFWQFKIEVSVLNYLRHPKAAFASVSIPFVLSGLLAVIVVALVYFALAYITMSVLDSFSVPGWAYWQWHIGYIVLVLLIMACLFGNIRGMHIRPNNPTMAYFSSDFFLNHCALNPLYNFIYSFSVKDSYARDFRFFKNEDCEKDFAGLFPTIGTPQIELLKTPRPNILLVVWESLSARYIGRLGGEKGVMPEFESLCDEGVLFSRCDCGSFRTERGLVCVLAGIPGQPTDTLAKHTAKLPNMPALPRRLRDEGYETMALHGGNCLIMHKSDLYLATGHSTLIQQKDLPNLGDSNRWGYHDGGTMKWLYGDIQKKTQEGKRWFTTYQTLSSHEPFIVPYSRLDDMKANSFAYVDHCFGKFIAKLKISPAWDNLLVIVTGDHGFNFCEQIDRDTYPHIPMLWLGGAVKHPMVIDKIVAQTDIAATLLGQLRLPHNEFKFSRDVLADTYTYPFALHTYNNGFLFRDETGFTNYDNVADRAVEGHDLRREHIGKVILQTLYKYLNKL